MTRVAVTFNSWCPWQWRDRSHGLFEQNHLYYRVDLQAFLLRNVRVFFLAEKLQTKQVHCCTPEVESLKLVYEFFTWSLQIFYSHLTFANFTVKGGFSMEF